MDISPSTELNGYFVVLMFCLEFQTLEWARVILSWFSRKSNVDDGEEDFFPPCFLLRVKWIFLARFFSEMKSSSSHQKPNFVPEKRRSNFWMMREQLQMILGPALCREFHHFPMTLGPKVKNGKKWTVRLFCVKNNKNENEKGKHACLMKVTSPVLPQSRSYFLCKNLWNDLVPIWPNLRKLEDFFHTFCIKNFFCLIPNLKVGSQEKVGGSW